MRKRRVAGLVILGVAVWCAPGMRTGEVEAAGVGDASSLTSAQAALRVD